MFITATYKVRADEHDFPFVGQVLEGEYEGVKVSTVVKEIQKMKWLNPDWKEKQQVPILIIQLLVQIDEEQFARQKRKQKMLTENKLVIFDGGSTNEDLKLDDDKE
ncbi:hypothetical protein [Gracilibacillus thailandensis]|uniref:Uncharacterized protein n=1 Tax=Gracilibacillus thailandensis TaxID=563735 RepID=A0A6N7QZ43_9BACI|nr:hypothetical protein [Gracilibacillus thailandensis]MRI66145.1 hypothetical protein [Gracilibacillus thailandensis]